MRCLLRGRRCGRAGAGRWCVRCWPVGARSTEFRGRGLVADPVGIVADGDEELPGNFSADAVELDEAGGSVGHQGINLGAELLDLIIQRLPGARAR